MVGSLSGSECWQAVVVQYEDFVMQHCIQTADRSLDRKYIIILNKSSKKVYSNWNSY